MSLRNRWEDKLKGNRAAGVEVHIQGTSARCHFVVAEKKKNKIEIRSSGSAQLSKLQLPAGIPVNVSISGKGIIHKRVAWTDGMSEASLLQKVLPNAKQSDLYIQHTAPANDHVFVSVARKNTLDEILDHLRKGKHEVVSCTLGPFCITSIAGSMVNEGSIAEQIILPGHTITLLDGQVEDHTVNEKELGDALQVGSDRVDAEHIIPFAAAVAYFTGSDIVTGIPSVNEQSADSRQKRIFQLAGAATLALLFTVLLTNYFVFNHYWQKKQALESQASLNQDALQRYNELKKQYDDKMTFLKASGLLESSRASFFADRLAMDIPPVIKLTDMDISPRMRTADEDAVQFENKLIRVSGSCRQSNELNEWIKIIRKKDWVSDVELINYKQGKSDPVGEFIINIKTR